MLAGLQGEGAVNLFSLSTWLCLSHSSSLLKGLYFLHWLASRSACVLYALLGVIEYVKTFFFL